MVSIIKKKKKKTKKKIKNIIKMSISLDIDDIATDNNNSNDGKLQISKLLYSSNTEYIVTWSKKSEKDKRDCLIVGWKPDKDEVGKLKPETSYEVKEENQIKCF